MERITDKNGNNRFILTDKQEMGGRNVGWSIHQNCFICHKYLTPWGKQITYKLHSNAWPAKCPFVRRIGVNQRLEGKKVVWMSILVRDVKLLVAMGMTATTLFSQRTYKCS